MQDFMRKFITFFFLNMNDIRKFRSIAILGNFEQSADEVRGDLIYIPLIAIQ